jgi:hypothetical protein
LTWARDADEADGRRRARGEVDHAVPDSPCAGRLMRTMMLRLVLELVTRTIVP